MKTVFPLKKTQIPLDATSGLNTLKSELLGSFIADNLEAVKKQQLNSGDYSVTSAQTLFLEYHKKYPHIYLEYLRFARELHAAGVRRKSISMITERIRWNTATRGGDDFKINNTLRAGYSRLLMWRNPEFQYPGCFRLKKSRIDGVFDVDFKDFRTWDSNYWDSFPKGK